MPEISDDHEELVTVVSSLLSGFALERTCGSCNGTGELRETRERHLNELTSKQSQFLYQALIEREKAKNGGEEAMEEAKRAQRQAQQGGQPGGSRPPTPGTQPSGGAPGPM